MSEEISPEEKLTRAYTVALLNASEGELNRLEKSMRTLFNELVKLRFGDLDYQQAASQHCQQLCASLPPIIHAIKDIQEMRTGDEE